MTLRDLNALDDDERRRTLAKLSSEMVAISNEYGLSVERVLSLIDRVGALAKDFERVDATGWQSSISNASDTVRAIKFTRR